MILWMIKLFGFVRKAIAGRRYPSQLAWAVAFGILLGIVPHGNLLAIALLIVVLSLKLNHAMAMLTAVGASFLAVKLDPVSHAVGDYLYSQPQFAEIATKAWALPMVPWTDLNNTVVLGSLTIGLAALLPVFMITYPFFRLFAPKVEQEEEAVVAEPNESNREDRSPASRESNPQVVYVDRGGSQVPPPHRKTTPASRPVAASNTATPNNPTNSKGQRIDFVEVDSAAASSAAAGQHAGQTAAGTAPVETRIDVIRVKEPGEATAAQAGVSPESASSADSPNPNQPPQPMDEALNYLLRQLRDSQQRNAA